MNNIDSNDAEYFNKIYDRIIYTYNKGYASNGQEFLDYIRAEEDVENILKNVNEISDGLHNLKSSVVYRQKEFAEIFYNSIVDAYDNGLISNAEDFLEYIANREDISNFYVMTLAVIADTIEDVYFDMTSVYYSDKIDFALGEDLDSIGEKIGCPRPQATHSIVQVNFSVSTPATETLPIPEGTVVSTNGGNRFISTSDAYISIGNNNVDVECVSENVGTGTRILSNSVNKLESNLNWAGVTGVIVNNEESSSGGRDAYTDDEYRELLRDWVNNQIRGSRAAYERYFSNFDGLDSYKLIPNWDVSGTLKIVLDPGYPYQLLSAYDEIMRSVAQIDDDIVMCAPEKVNISVYAKCNVDIDLVNPYSSSEKEEIKSRIVDAIRAYINGDVYNTTGLGIGEDFIPFQLGLFVSENVPEIKNISFVKSNKVNDRVVDSEGNVCVWLSEPVSIGDDEIAFIDNDDIIVEME